MLRSVTFITLRCRDDRIDYRRALAELDNSFLRFNICSFYPEKNWKPQSGKSGFRFCIL